MAIYINPPTESKEAFLTRYGRISTTPRDNLKDLASAHICYRAALRNRIVFVFHVLNPSFTALAIADSPRELHYLANLDDARPIHMYEVRVGDIEDEDVGGVDLSAELQP